MYPVKAKDLKRAFVKSFELEGWLLQNANVEIYFICFAKNEEQSSVLILYKKG
jgi:hypothetical protein